MWQFWPITCTEQKFVSIGRMGTLFIKINYFISVKGLGLGIVSVTQRVNKEMYKTYYVCHLSSNLFKFGDNFICGLGDVGSHLGFFQGFSLWFWVKILKFRFCLLIVKMEQEMIYHDVLEGGVEEGRMEAANT